MTNKLLETEKRGFSYRHISQLRTHYKEYIVLSRCLQTLRRCITLIIHSTNLT